MKIQNSNQFIVVLAIIQKITKYLVLKFVEIFKILLILLGLIFALIYKEYSAIGAVLILTSLLFYPPIYNKLLIIFKTKKLLNFILIGIIFIGFSLIFNSQGYLEYSKKNQSEKILNEKLKNQSKNIKEGDIDITKNKIESEEEQKTKALEKLLDESSIIQDVELYADSNFGEDDIVQVKQNNAKISFFSNSTVDKKSFKVNKVLDGDTVKIENIGTVRLIGIDSPETNKDQNNSQCFAENAKIALSDLILNKNVFLEFNPKARIDKYGRTLAYILTENKIDINKEMISKGMAFSYKTHTHLKLNEYNKEEAAAKIGNTGIFSKDNCNGEKDLQINITNRISDLSKKESDLNNIKTDNTKPRDEVSTPKSAPQLSVTPSPNIINPVAPPVLQTSPAQNASKCDPSYPDLCIPNGISDLNCPDIKSRKFRVQGIDIHNFDSDKDGIGCESVKTKWNGKYSY